MTSGDDAQKGRRGARAGRGRKAAEAGGSLFDPVPAGNAVGADAGYAPEPVASDSKLSNDAITPPRSLRTGSAAAGGSPSESATAEPEPFEDPPVEGARSNAPESLGTFARGHQPFPSERGGSLPVPLRAIEGARSVSPFEQLKRQVEAVLFASEGPLDLSEIRGCLGEVAREDVRLALRGLSKDYEDRAFFLFESGGRYQLRTRPEYSDVVNRQFTSKPRNLSKAAIETLCIIAYRQPVTRAEINALRGTDSSSIVAALKEKDLIAVAGQRKEVGSPLEFKTTQKFLEVFGLASLKELPHLRSLQMNVEDQKQVASSLAELDGRIDEEPPTAAELAFPESGGEETGASEGGGLFEAEGPLGVSEPDA